MSRFSDLVQKLNPPKGSPSTAVETGSGHPETELELDRTLSALLPREISYPDRIENGTASPPSFSKLIPPDPDYPASGEGPSPFDRIAVEKIVVEPESRIVFHTDPGSPGADRFRLLRMRLRTLRNARKIKTVLITSPSPGDGKSTIALNLATVLAEGGKRTVLLIEADLHRSPLTQVLRVKDGSGLAECLENNLNPFATIRRLDPLGWYLMPAGHSQGNPTELLQGEKLLPIIQKLCVHFEWVLIDSPPLIPLTDALLLGRHTNGTLLVTKAGKTRGDAIDRAINLLGREHLLGIVLNGIEELHDLYSEYYRYDAASNAEGNGKGGGWNKHGWLINRDRGQE